MDANKIENDGHSFTGKVVVVAAEIDTFFIVRIIELVIQFQFGVLLLVVSADRFQIGTSLSSPTTYT